VSYHDLIDSRITRDFLSFRKNDTVDKVKYLLYTKAKEFESIGYIYITEDDVLAGIVSLKQVLQSPEHTTLESIMDTDVVSLQYHAHQERAIYLALEHGLKAIPVIDNNRKLIGIVTHKTILSIFHHEFRKDILTSGGIHHAKEIESIETPVSKLVKARLPSLLLGLVGGLVAATIVTGFEGLLNSYIVLASFIPAIVYLTDAVGTQSQTLVVRLIAIEPKFSRHRYLLREIKIGLILGTSFAILLFLAGLLGWGQTNLALIIGISIFISMVFQTFFAAYFSFILQKLRVDPAIASGPIATIISDITTIAIYFGMATILLGFL
jgi:magnesium transporter